MVIDFTELITWAIEALTAIILLVLGSKVIPFLKEKGFYNFTACMVKAAATYFLDGQGKEKFEWVFSQVNAKYGMFFDVDVIKDTIQAAYVDMCVSLGKVPALSRADEYEEETTEEKTED